MNKPLEHREAWLEAVMPHVTAHFKAKGYEVPELIRFACGWPHKGGVGRKKKRIGECWDASASTDKHFQIFISPVLEEPIKVVGVLMHEVVHAVVGLKAGHKKPFAKCAGDVGLTKPWTGTGESEELVAEIKGWLEKVGPYPHGSLKYSAVSKDAEKGRMLKLECKCGLKIRSTQKWIDQYGEEWPCPCGGSLLASGQDE